MAELKNDLEDNIRKMLQQNFEAFMPQTLAATPAAATTKNQTIWPTTLRQEIKSIMNEVLSEKNQNAENKSKTPLRENAKCQLVI